MSRKFFARSALSVVRFSCKRAGVHVQISNAGLLICLPVDLLKFSRILSTPPLNLHSTFIFGSAGASPSQAHRINFGSAGTSPSEFFRRARLWRADFSVGQEPDPPKQRIFWLGGSLALQKCMESLRSPTQQLCDSVGNPFRCSPMLCEQLLCLPSDRPAKRF